MGADDHDQWRKWVGAMHGITFTSIEEWVKREALFTSKVSMSCAYFSSLPFVTKKAATELVFSMQESTHHLRQKSTTPLLLLPQAHLRVCNHQQWALVQHMGRQNLDPQRGPQQWLVLSTIYRAVEIVPACLLPTKGRHRLFWYLYIEWLYKI